MNTTRNLFASVGSVRRPRAKPAALGSSKDNGPQLDVATQPRRLRRLNGMHNTYKTTGQTKPKRKRSDEALIDPPAETTVTGRKRPRVSKATAKRANAPENLD